MSFVLFAVYCLTESSTPSGGRCCPATAGGLMGPSGWSWGPWSWLGSFASHPLPYASRPGVSCSFCAKCLLSPDLLAPQEASGENTSDSPQRGSCVLFTLSDRGRGSDAVGFRSPNRRSCAKKRSPLFSPLLNVSAARGTTSGKGCAPTPPLVSPAAAQIDHYDHLEMELSVQGAGGASFFSRNLLLEGAIFKATSVPDETSCFILLPIDVDLYGRFSGRSWENVWKEHRGLSL